MLYILYLKYHNDSLYFFNPHSSSELFFIIKANYFVQVKMLVKELCRLFSAPIPPEVDTLKVVIKIQTFNLHIYLRHQQ